MIRSKAIFMCALVATRNSPSKDSDNPSRTPRHGNHPHDGNLVLDGSYFEIDGGFPAFEDNGDNPYAPFLVEPSAYLTNLNLMHFQIRADERGTQA